MNFFNKCERERDKEQQFSPLKNDKKETDNERQRQKERETADSHIYIYTVCPRSSDPFYIVSYNIKWVTTSWTHRIDRL